MTTQQTPIAAVYSKRYPPDEDLVHRALDGDAWAEEAIYRKYVNNVASLAAKLLRRQVDVDDVVQDTFIEALRDLDQLRDPSKLKSWLLRITVRRVQVRFRKRRIRQWLGFERTLDDEKLIEQASVDASQDIMTELSLLDSAFDHMTGKDKTCWVLRCMEGFRLEEIATLTGASLATVKRRIRSAQRVLEHYISQGGGHAS